MRKSKSGAKGRLILVPPYVPFVPYLGSLSYQGKSFPQVSMYTSCTPKCRRESVVKWVEEVVCATRVDVSETGMWVGKVVRTYFKDILVKILPF